MSMFGSSEVEFLRKQNESLLAQVQRLTEMIANMADPALQARLAAKPRTEEPQEDQDQSQRAMPHAPRFYRRPGVLPTTTVTSPAVSIEQMDAEAKVKESP